MILIIDNTKNLNNAYMTPKLIKYLEKNYINYKIIKTLNDMKNINNLKIKGIILSGGPLLLSKEIDINLINKNIAILLNFPNIPVLGICFGFQLIATIFGGKIKSLKNKIEGIYKVNIQKINSIILKNITKKEINVFQSHQDIIFDLPNDFNIIIYKDKIIQGIEHKNKKIWGFQFHPEALNETIIIIKNFLYICYN